MTTRQQNAAVRKLLANIEKAAKESERTGDSKAFFQYLDSEAKEEFLRLYLADNTMRYLTLKSLRIMIYLNLKYRFVALHTFGMYIVP